MDYKTSINDTLALRSACKEIPELAASEMMAILYENKDHDIIAYEF